jgi:hypothetical protein
LFGKRRGVTYVRKLSQAADTISEGHGLLIAAVRFICILAADLQSITLYYKPVVRNKRYVIVCVMIVELYFIGLLPSQSGPGSSVGIVTGYGLNGPGIESRWRVRFSAPVQTGPGAHPAYGTMGTGYFRGVKSGRGVTLTPHHFLVSWS